VDLDPGDICCESGISTGGVGTTTAFLDFPSEAKCQAAAAALAGADQINPSRGNHPNISPSATYRILCPLRRALKAKLYPAPAAWSLQRSGRASACLSAGRLNDCRCRHLRNQRSLRMPYPRAAIQTPLTATASPTTATGQAVRIASPAFATMCRRSLSATAGFSADDAAGT
jgi:hypothetical protein